MVSRLRGNDGEGDLQGWEDASGVNPMKRVGVNFSMLSTCRIGAVPAIEGGLFAACQ